MATPKTFGYYPPELLRFSEENEHAKQFLAGVIRLGSLCYYKFIPTRNVMPIRRETIQVRAGV